MIEKNNIGNETVSEQLKVNQNVIKPADERASAQIQMRITPGKKSRYVLEAKRKGMRVSEWIQKHMDAVCNEAKPERKSKS